MGRFDVKPLRRLLAGSPFYRGCHAVGYWWRVRLSYNRATREVWWPRGGADDVGYDLKTDVHRFLFCALRLKFGMVLRTTVERRK